MNIADIQNLLRILSGIIPILTGNKDYFKYNQQDNFISLSSVTLQFLYNVMFESLSVINVHLVLLGAITNIEKITIKNNQPYQLNFDEIIGKGQLIFITYTPQFHEKLSPNINYDDYFFSEYIDNNLQEKNNIKRKTLFFISKTLKNYDTEVEFDICYTYLPSNLKNNLIIDYLLSAFIKYSRFEFNDMILKLHLSIEFLKNSLKNKLKNKNISCKEKNIKKILDIYFEHFIEQNDKIPIPHFILEQLNDIYEKRKYIMHEGNIINSITKEDAKKFIISTYLLYKYCENILELNFIQD